MKTLYPVRGIITVLNTPFDAHGRIAEDDLRQNVRLALRAGVAGFLVPALASEVYSLRVEERLQMVAAVREEVGGQVPVFAGAGETTPVRRLQMVEHYRELGCQEVLLQIPFTNEAEFKKEFYQLADKCPEVLMLQDWDASGYGLPEALVLELFHDVENFRCLKVETVPAGVKYSRLGTLTEGQLHLSGGWAVTQMIEGLRRGVHAFMPTGMHRIYTALYQYFQAGQFEKAEALFHQLLPVLAFSNQHLDISLHFFKRLLHRQGVYGTSLVRAPTLPFDTLHEQLADELIERVIRLERELGGTLEVL